MRSVPSAEPRPLLLLVLLTAATARRRRSLHRPGSARPTSLDAATLEQAGQIPSHATRPSLALVEAADVHALPVLEALLEGNLYRGPAAILLDREGTLQDALTGAPVTGRPRSAGAGDDQQPRSEARSSERSRRSALLPSAPGATRRGARPPGGPRAPRSCRRWRRRSPWRTTRQSRRRSARRRRCSPWTARTPRDGSPRSASSDGAHGKRLLVQRLRWSRTRRCAPRCQDAIRSVDLRAPARGDGRAALLGAEPGQRPAARRARAGNHLRPDGRHQHGPRRAADDRRLRDLAACRGSFRGRALFDWYLVAAVPASFLAAALVGALLELTVVRRLYGRPLETLLATWGVEPAARSRRCASLFGAQNVEVANPRWMSGGARRCSRTWSCPGTASSSSRFSAAVLARGVGCCSPGTRLGPPGPGGHPGPRRAAAPGRADAARRPARLRGRVGHRRSRRLRALADRQRGSRARPGLHRRLVHGGRAGRRRDSSPAPPSPRRASGW